VTVERDREVAASGGGLSGRAESAQITITVAGREVARLVPTGRRQWVGGGSLKAVWRTPTPRALPADNEQYPGTIMDPFT